MHTCTSDDAKHHIQNRLNGVRLKSCLGGDVIDTAEHIQLKFLLLTTDRLVLIDCIIDIINSVWFYFREPKQWLIKLS